MSVPDQAPPMQSVIIPPAPQIPYGKNMDFHQQHQQTAAQQQVGIRFVTSHFPPRVSSPRLAVPQLSELIHSNYSVAATSTAFPIIATSTTHSGTAIPAYSISSTNITEA